MCEENFEFRRMRILKHPITKSIGKKCGKMMMETPVLRIFISCCAMHIKKAGFVNSLLTLLL